MTVSMLYNLESKVPFGFGGLIQPINLSPHSLPIPYLFSFMPYAKNSFLSILTLVTVSSALMDDYFQRLSNNQITPA